MKISISFIFIFINFASAKSPLSITRISENRSLSKIGSEVYIEYNKIKCSLKSFGELSNQEGEMPKSFKIELSCNEKSQILWDITKPVEGDFGFDEPKFELLYAGFIDQDGLLDLKLEMSPKYSCSKVVEYLSSKAKANEIVGISGKPKTICGE